MRVYRIVAVVVVVLAAVSVKLLFIAARIVEAEARSIGSATIDVAQMHQGYQGLARAEVPERVSLSRP